MPLRCPACSAPAQTSPPPSARAPPCGPPSSPAPGRRTARRDRRLAAHGDHDPRPQRRRCGDHSVEHARRACEEIHVQDERNDPDEKGAARMQGDAVRAAVQLRVERHGMCSARARESRSTPERVCFTTCPDATLPFAAREVTFYLAVPSPSSSASPSLSPHQLLVASAPSRVRVRLAGSRPLPDERAEVHTQRGTMPRSRSRWPHPEEPA
jgi:hypothetical protein